MGAVGSSETLVITYKIERRHYPDDHNWHLHRCENLKSDWQAYFTNNLVFTRSSSLTTREAQV
jgi:hypothetical protein